MSPITHALEYSIVYRDEKTKGMREKTVTGYPLSLSVPGTFAIRKALTVDGTELWKIDHVESGFSVASGNCWNAAVEAAEKLIAKNGAEGFMKAFAEAREKRTAAGLQPLQTERSA